MRSRIVEGMLDVRDAIYVAAGLAYYGVRHKTPERSYQGMVRLFCRTGGHLNDLISKGVSALRPPAHLRAHDGVLGALDDTRRETIREHLDRDGYYVFDQLLPDALCARLLELASRTPSLALDAGTDGDKILLIDRAAPRAVRYDLQPDDLVNDRDVQALLADWSLLTVAQDYLRAAPIVDIVAMWWHTAFSDRPDARAAQYFHFDMDRPRWLKFFFYLTDVGPENGPHCFIRGSHRTGGIADDLRAKGYARLTDSEIAEHYDAGDVVRFTGRKGTIIAEDTRGLHKGQHVERGDRLVFQLEFTNTLFGGRYIRPQLRDVVDDAFRDRLRDYPRVYSVFESC